MGRTKRFRPNRYLRNPINEEKRMLYLIFQNNIVNDVQLLISQLHKNERLNDPKLTSKEKALLEMKVRLNDGSMGYVFTISKHQYCWKYACHVCKVPNMSEQELYLHIVTPRHVNRLKMTVHLKHKFLLKEVNSSFANEEREEIEEDENQTVCQIQSSLDSFKKPLVGLEYLIELVGGRNNKIEYFCLICSRLDTQTTLLDHLINYNHYIKFMTMFFPSVSQKLKAVKNKGLFSNYIKLITHVADSVEHVYGRLKPKQVESKAFSHTSKLSLLEKIDKGRHFRETSENTFEECVNLSHLQPGVCPVLVRNRRERIGLQENTFVKKEPLIVEERNKNAGEYHSASDRGFAGHNDTIFGSLQLQGGRGEQNRARDRSYDDGKQFDLKTDRDSIHRSLFQSAPVRDYQSTPTFKQRISNSSDYLSHEDPGKQALSSQEETYSSSATENCDVISVLRQLLLLENHLGSLGPKVRDLVLEVSRMAMSSKNVIHLVVSNQEHYVFLETVKHKLIGCLEFGFIKSSLCDIAQNAVEKITLLLSYEGVKSECVDEKTLNSERHPHDREWPREKTLNSERNPHDREWPREKTLNSERNPHDREWLRENILKSESHPYDEWSREKTLNSERNRHDREWSKEKTLNSERNPHDREWSREKTLNSERHSYDIEWSREKTLNSERNPHDREWSREKTLNSETNIQNREWSGEKTLNSERNIQNRECSGEKTLNSERRPHDREWSREKTLNSERNIQNREWSREKTLNSERNIQNREWSGEKTLNSERNPHDREWSGEKTLNSERHPHDREWSREKTLISERHPHDRDSEKYSHEGKWSSESTMTSERHTYDREKTLNSETHLHDGECSRQINRSGLTISEIPNFIEKHYLVAHLSFIEKENLCFKVYSYLNNQNKFEVSEDDLIKILSIVLKSSPREECHDDCGSSQQWSRSSPRVESHDYNLQSSRSSQQWSRREFYSDRGTHNRVSYGTPTRE